MKTIHLSIFALAAFLTAVFFLEMESGMNQPNDIADEIIDSASEVERDVPEMSNIPDALERPSMYQGMFLPPSRYDSTLLAARRRIAKPMAVTATR